MHSFWDQIFLSNPLRKWVWVGIAILLALVLKRFLSRYLAKVLYRLIKKASGISDRNAFVNLIAAPISTFLFIFISFAALEKLKFPLEIDFDIFNVPAKTITHQIATFVFIIGFIWLLLRSIDFVAMILAQKTSNNHDLKDNQLVVFFRDFLKVLVGIIGALMVLSDVFDVEVSKLTAGLGLAGAALALAAKETVENLIASFIIFFDKPFTTGDYIKVQSYAGNIERIGLRSTRIRTDGTTFVTVPNKQMVDSIVDNISERTQLKGEARLQISLSTSPDQMDQLTEGIKKILKKDKIISFTVFLNDISVTAFAVNVDYFISLMSYVDFINLKQQVNLEIIRLMEKLNIELAGESTSVNLVNKTNN